MGWLVCSLLLLAVALDSVFGSNRFFMSAPKVFHVDVEEKVVVQSSSVVTLHLEDERSGHRLSDTKTVQPSASLQEVMLKIEKEGTPPPQTDRRTWSKLAPFKDEPYLLLVATEGRTRRMTRVLVSVHKGYIFIQTNQPIYKPNDKVMYRVFSLDHAMRPLQDTIQISVFNPSGIRLQLDTSLWSAVGGMHSGVLHLPDMAGLGAWKIQAHFEGDKKYATTVEFQVEKYVLPSFEVTIHADERFILLESPALSFGVKAKYSYGAQVQGSFHTWFRVEGVEDSEGCLGVTQMIQGLEKTGSVVEGEGTVTLPTAELKQRLLAQGCDLSSLEQRGGQLVMSAFVTEQSGETQEAEISLPIAARRYQIDFSRTREYFIPGAQLLFKVLLHLPDGSPAVGVPVELHVEPNTVSVVTDQEGAASHALDLPKSPPEEITVNVKAGSTEKQKVVRRMSSPSQQYLRIYVRDQKVNVGKQLEVHFNALPDNGLAVDMYYLVLSHGVLVHQGSVRSAKSGVAIEKVGITAQMVPSFRLIGYYYNPHDALISDSVWVDVVDECENKVTMKTSGVRIRPGTIVNLEVEVTGSSRVALVAVDTAMYSLNRRNKLTAKQVFSAMESYDLGCSYGGGPDPESIFTDAGLSFVSTHSDSTVHGFRCGSEASSRQRRAVDLQDDLMVLKANMSAELQQCCVQGFSAIPMRMSCDARARRVSQMDAGPQCVVIFLKCCLKGEATRRKAMEDVGLGRTSSLLKIEEYFINNLASKIRRNFAPSFAFTYFDVTNTEKKSFTLSLPDSITTWEIQAVTLSATHGFCVVEPLKLTVKQDVFVSLRLPYSVRIYEQLSIVVVIYNYGQDDVQLAVHMAQVPGLCSPGSSSFGGFVNLTVGAESSQLVTFAAIPMVTGAIPIKIRIIKINGNSMFDMDAIEKNLNVWAEGQEKTKELTKALNLNGRSSFNIDGQLPNGTIPGSASSLFIKMEGAGFGQSSARSLLFAEGVASLLGMPTGCAEQTMTTMAPTVLALRYLDLTQQWFHLPLGTRDKALLGTEKGLINLLSRRNPDGSYPLWNSAPASHWLTAYVVKVLSLLAERQSTWAGREDALRRDVNNQDISNSVRFLRSVQTLDGSFSDPHSVIRREFMGGMMASGMRVTNTAFITVALHHASLFVEQSMKSDVVATINLATAYLLSRLKEIKSPYEVAITAYCLALCLPDKEAAKPAWQQLQALSTLDDNGCLVWKANPESRGQKDAITVETTAYALLTAVAHQDFQWAANASCSLVAQENYGGGFRSTQDTVMALEALAEYDVRKPAEPEFNTVKAEFFVTGRPRKVAATLLNPKDMVEVQLKTMIGNKINVELTGNGKIKLKVQTRFHVMEPQEPCKLLNINVTLEGKTEYTSTILNNYQYFDPDYVYEAVALPPNGPPRRRRNAAQSSISENSVRYTVCVSLNSRLTGMAIADITLLSGFEPNKDDLELLKSPPELYISHYEILNGRLILYFNEFKEKTHCVAFEAQQTVPISLLQPAAASFYDYYEPKTKCTIFYSAPKRSTEVSKLCSGDNDVCQCAERPCHTLVNVLQNRLKQGSRIHHACFYPVVDYRFVVEVVSVSYQSNFRLYDTTVLKVLKQTKDTTVAEGSSRVFVNRLQCKAKLELDKQYLIMGKDGATTDSEGNMQYLLEANTWVELSPGEKMCAQKRYKKLCESYNAFASNLQDCHL